MEYLSVLMDKYIRKDVEGLDEDAKRKYLAEQKKVQDGFLAFLGPCVDECTCVDEAEFKSELQGFLNEFGKKYPRIKEFVKLDWAGVILQLNFYIWLVLESCYTKDMVLSFYYIMCLETQEIRTENLGESTPKIWNLTEDTKEYLFTLLDHHVFWDARDKFLLEYGRLPEEEVDKEDFKKRLHEFRMMHPEHAHNILD